MDLRRLTHLARPVVGAITITLAAASCGRDVPPPAPQSVAGQPQNDLLGWTGNLVGTLLTCRPQPYAADSALIGPAGGTLSFGTNTLVIPAGALDHSVMVKGVAPSDTVNSVVFYPQGLEFERPASLTMSYANCGIVTWLLPRIAFTTDDLVILYLVPSLPNVFRKQVTGRIEHFTRYAMAW